MSPNVIKQSFAVVGSLPSIEHVKVVRLRTTGNFFVEVVGMTTTKLQIGQLQSKVEFLVVLELATNVILETAFI